jgi:hypothetical protein
MPDPGTWEANVGTGAGSGFGGAGFVAGMGGLGGTSGLYDSASGVDKRAVAQTCLKVGAACAAGVSTFASSTTAGGGAVAGAVLGMVTDAVGGGLQAYDAQKCRATLEWCLSTARSWARQGLPGCDDELITTLEGCIAKQNIKFRTGVGKATIVGQPGVALYRAGKAIFKAVKGTKGVGRARRAAYLVDKAKEDSNGGTIAREAIKAIMGMQFDQIATKAVADAMKSS